MSETPDFSNRVEIADKLIDVVKRIVRILGGSPAPDAEDREVLLSENMVHLRNLLVQVRDEIGMDHGPLRILEGDSEGFVFSDFVAGCRTILHAYFEIQQNRCDDIDWTDAAKERDNLISGIKSLLDFQALAYAWENNMSRPAAKSLLQLARDRRRINAPTEDDGSEPLETDADQLRPTITAADLEKLYYARARQIREFLVSAGLGSEEEGGRKGKKGRSFRFDKAKAMKACDRRFSRKEITAQ